MLSIIIPSRNERFLKETVNDVLEKARGEIEVIVVLDENDQPLDPHPKVVVIKKEGLPGLRSAISQGVDIAKGEYIMKTDAHCMFDEGFDVKLIADCKDNWIVIPRRYSLSASKWEIKHNRPVIDYEYIVFPFVEALTSVRLGGKWYERAIERSELLLDENMTFQGSCWFTTKQHFENIGRFDLEAPDKDQFVLESEELSLKTWLSGGKVMTNKRTWYAHLHKGNRYGRGYKLSSKRMKQHRLYHIDYWFNDKWPQAKYKLEWLVEQFLPIPGWPEDWQDPKHKEQFLKRI